MRLLNQTITTGLKRKELPPVVYERIDSNNVRIGTKWFKYRPAIITWPKLDLMPTYRPIEVSPFGVTIYHDPGTKQFKSNDWYNINTLGTYEEFERSFELWIKRL